MFWIGLAIILISMYLLVVSHHNAEKYEFFGETPWFFWLGVYRWGEGLIIAPFWIVVGLLSMLFLREVELVRIYLLFQIIRSIVEVLDYSVRKVDKEDKVPIFNRLEHFSEKEQIVFYRMAQIMVVVGLLFVWNYLPS